MTTKISTGSAVVSTVVSTFGTGILFMPSLFMNLGYPLALTSLAIICVMTAFTLYLISNAAIQTEAKEDASYSSLASTIRSFFGPLIQISLFLSNFGAALYIGLRFTEFSTLLLQQYGCPPYTFYIIASVLSLLSVYFCSLRDISALSFIGKISLTSVLYYLLTTVYYAFRFGNFSIMNTKIHDFSVVGNAVLALHCQYGWLDLYSSLADRSLGNVTFISIAAAIGMFFIYSASGFFGYMAVGNSVGSIVLESYLNKSSALVNAIKTTSFDKHAIMPLLAVCGFLFVWFGFVMYSGYSNVNVLQPVFNALFGRKVAGSEAGASVKPVSRSIIGLLYSFVLMVGIIVAKIEFVRKFLTTYLLAIVSAIFTNPLSFLFPALFTIELTPKLSTIKMLSYMLATFSIGYGVFILYSVAKTMIAGK